MALHFFRIYMFYFLNSCDKTHTVAIKTIQSSLRSLPICSPSKLLPIFACRASANKQAQRSSSLEGIDRVRVMYRVRSCLSFQVPTVTAVTHISPADTGRWLFLYSAYLLVFMSFICPSITYCHHTKINIKMINCLKRNNVQIKWREQLLKILLYLLLSIYRMEASQAVHLGLCICNPSLWHSPCPS